MSLEEKLDRIRSSPKLQNQHQTALVLSAVEDTLKSSSSNAATALTPTSYFAALLSLLGQHISSSRGILNKDIAYAVVYLLDLVTPHVPPPLLREKFSQILTGLAPALTHQDADAPLLRSSMGCLESLLKVQTIAAWQLGQAQISPRRALAGLLSIASDHRPKVRKRAQEAIASVLKSPPPSPSLDHPAADMCAESALLTLQDLVEAANKGKKSGKKATPQHDPALIHALQLVKTIANASGGWPSKKIDALCDLLLNVSRSSNEFLTMAAFDIFEVIFAGMAEDPVSSAKLPHLLEVIEQLQPAATDTQLLPPWIAVLSRAYDVLAQVSPEDTFQALPVAFAKLTNFLTSPSHNIRVSASECLISFLANCIPTSIILEPSIYDEKTLEKVAAEVTGLLDVKYQSAWMEVFSVLEAVFDAFHFRSSTLMTNVLRTVGDLRGRESFMGKAEADAVLSKAIQCAGPEAVLDTLPLNLVNPGPNSPGRAWLLPLVRDNVSNTRLSHFRQEFVPLSESMYQRILNHGSKEKTTEIKIFETIVQQIWSCLPGYCELPLDLTGSFDQEFAEMLSNLLYQQPELRTDVCRALQALVESNKAVVLATGEDESIKLSRVSKVDAQGNLKHLEGFAGNLLAVLFNVYSQTLPHNRGVLLQCINAYLSITPEQELMETFTKVSDMLEAALQETKPRTHATNGDKQKPKGKTDKMPPTSHTLMDLLITLSVYLPRSSYKQLFGLASNMISKDDDVQLQKKAYKLIPRLAESDIGKEALKDSNIELQQLLLASAEKVSPPSRRDRLAALEKVVEHLPDDDLSFIASVLPEVVIATKEVNEKARMLSFVLLVSMGCRMKQGGTVRMSKVPHMDAASPDTAASLEEYLTMVSAGLAGSTPHAISAAVTACTRILYEFREDLQEATVVELVEMMDLFLQNKNREIVRSVLGFVKVCVISLPDKVVRPRLATLMGSLMMWSHEHKGQLKAKVKHIVERMIRRFGVEEVDRACPEEDRKLIANIRKTKDRKKRAKDGRAGDDDDASQAQPPRKGAFENEFDEAIYGSSDDGSIISNSDDDQRVKSAENGQRRNGKRGQGQTYIVEDEDEPLDLLDSRALGRISSTRPLPARKTKKTKAETNIDGKLIFNDDKPKVGRKKSQAQENDNDEVLEDADAAGDSVNAYVDAISSRDAGRRGQRGKLKFTNRPEREIDDGDDEDGMDVDGGTVKRTPTNSKYQPRKGHASPRGGRAGQRSPGNGMKAARSQRRGLGVPKRREREFVSSGRVSKGRGGSRG